MIQEIVHALINRIFHDKIIMGLLIIGILAILMGGMSGKDEPAPQSKGGQAGQEQQASEPQQSSESQQAQMQPPANPVEPSLAQDFIKWWLSMAMDYSAQTAAQNHQRAFSWMSKDAMLTFQSIYWPQDLANNVADGRVVAAFQPTSITAKAVNPNGSVVVEVQGTYILQTGGQPVPYQVKADFLVCRVKSDLRVAGVYNQLAAVPGKSVY